MSSLQKKIFSGLLVIFLSLLGYFLPHKPLGSSPPPLKNVLGQQAPNAGLSDLIIEPEAGNQFILDKINSAQKEIDMSMYLLSDPETISALIAAHNRGVTVRIILEKAPFGGGNVNKKSTLELANAGIVVHDPPALLGLIHQKSLIIDNQELLVLTLNLTGAAFKTNREYALTDRAPPDVAEVKTMFEDDWNRTYYSPNPTNLVISPNDSRTKLISLISDATKVIHIEDEVVEDPEIIDLLGNKAATSTVEVILSDPKKVAQNITTAQELRAKGVQIRFLIHPYLHAKLIVVDNQRAFIGSENLTRQSLDQNRELGIIFSNSDIVEKLDTQFAADWDAANDQ